MLFYRIENQKRRGPYADHRAAGILDRWMGGKLSSQRHPPLWSDSMLKDALKKDGISTRISSTNFRFGFSSMEQLRAWFFDDNVLLQLEDMGFVLGVYEADVWVGNCQAIILAEEHALENRREVHLLSSFCLTKK